MNRVHVLDEGNVVVGRFDYDRARVFNENEDWNGHNHVSVNTRRPELHQELLLTAQGRWVLHVWSQISGALPAFRYLRNAEARDWLIRNDIDDAVAEFFGEVAEEEGPESPEYNAGGRPAIGNRVNIALGELLGRVDTFALEGGINRAEAVRQLVLAGLVKHYGH